MSTIYQFIGNLDSIWIAAFAVILIILDVFIFGSTILLIVSVGMFGFIVLTFFIEDEIFLTWSIPAIIVILFAIQRFLINASVKQKLPHQSNKNGSFNATIDIADSPNASHDYFYGYKDEKQAVTNEKDNSAGLVFKAVLEDGRSFTIPFQEGLKPGMNIRVRVSNGINVKVEKIYG